MSKICVVSFCLIEPIFKSEIKVNYPAHNSLEIKCELKDPKIVWNGEKGTFLAEISYNGKTIPEENSTCMFTFPDLYYLATYDVKVFESHLFQHLPFFKAKESHVLELQCFNCTSSHLFISDYSQEYRRTFSFHYF